MNKIVKIENEQKQPEIDWGKKQYLISTVDTLVYYRGEHSSETFEGVLISGVHNPKLVNSWRKSIFRPLAKGEIVTVQFSND